MDITKLLDHLSLFESLISLPPEKLIEALHPYIALIVSVGRFFIILLFIIHLTSQLVTKPYDEFKASFLPNIYKLLAIMFIFGSTAAYNVVIRICIGIFDLLSDNVLQSQFVQFKGSFRSFIDAIAEQSKNGTDYFNVAAMSSSVVTFVLSIAIIALLITYYVFVSVGMFELLIILAVGPVVAAFYFFLKTPFERWMQALLACMLFPAISAVAITIINQSSLITGMEEHLLIGSLITLLLQLILAIMFLDLTILFHASFFGVKFINVPVVIKTLVMVAFGNPQSGLLNYGFILSTRKKGN
ncbi:MAG: hypothetical protein JXK07_13345 [Spirochaetes bacterium]|nr:hypothetical protein [Spirochaetota bacterium]